MMNAYWWNSNSTNNKGIKWLSWNNMSMVKGKGGMGFRNLHGFNISLLGKQCWNFIQNPNSLAARVFKARYFPDKHFLQATREGGSSFIWSGLWTAKEALKKGFLWVVGDGQSNEVYRDRWLRNKAAFFCRYGSHQLF